MMKGSKAQTLEDFHKFPRTRHIYDAGGTGVSRDDLVMDQKELKRFVTIPTTVEEKVDGANLGISVTSDYQVVFQNRSKIISSASHPQWKGLDSWVKNTPGLWDVLQSPDLILFGEWCYARHSVPYGNLPSYFIAFDLFIKSAQKFVSRVELERRLDGSGIHIVPKISGPRVHSKSELLAFLDTRSKYRRDNGPVEGVYVRIDNGLWSEERGKIVRPDFIQNIEDHWMKSDLVKNEVRYDEY
eukprot:TRINITY_DN3521_c0_g1_i3.p1 TRINITY_DN3521_c0_g1~~TRINITY_DN3521_c0_g1_i3.p1  ORF type:complete len:242 (+),score=40.87 TRINITY_DN3521_c0_g1_i3:97-822(+)